MKSPSSRHGHRRRRGHWPPRGRSSCPRGPPVSSPSPRAPVRARTTTSLAIEPFSGTDVTISPSIRLSVTTPTARALHRPPPNPETDVAPVIDYVDDDPS
uniref:Uncharacterized protein n=1 Tax=Triticum urartu TaxID=4572 RepID=A0A8R7UHL9_TRIUA